MISATRRTVVDLALWAVGTLVLLAAFTWIASALDSRALYPGGPPPHEPVLAIVQVPGSPPTVVTMDQLSGYGEGTALIPNPRRGWVPYGSGEKVSWAVNGDLVRVTWSNDDRSVTTVWKVDLAGMHPVRSERTAVGQMFLALLPTAVGSALLRYLLRRRSERAAAAVPPSGQATPADPPR